MIVLVWNHNPYPYYGRCDFYFFIFGVLIQLSAIFQLYQGDQF
jgi:hypothetical protein